MGWGVEVCWGVRGVRCLVSAVPVCVSIVNVWFAGMCVMFHVYVCARVLEYQPVLEVTPCDSWQHSPDLS